MRTFLAFLLCLPFSLFAQPPDVSQTLTFTGATAGAPVFVGAGGPNGIVGWRLTYFVDGTNITAAQVAIQGADAPNAAACSTATFATITTVGSSMVEILNPSASAAQGNVAVKSFYPCIRANVTAITGAGGTVKTWLAGYKGTFVFPQSFTFAPSGTQDVNLLSIGGVTLDVCTLKAVIPNPGTGSTQLVAVSGGTTIRVCKWSFTTDTLTTVQLVTGTGGACTTPTVETAVYSGQGGGVYGVFEDYQDPLITTAGKTLCIALSAGVTSTGGVTVQYTQR
jgi:hypothetical protein